MVVEVRPDQPTGFAMWSTGQMLQAATLRCAECGLPWARIQNGALLVMSHHSGHKHTNAIALADLLQLVVQLREEGVLVKSG